MQSMTIGTLTIHNLLEENNYWLESPIQGFDAPDYRVNEYDRSGEDGANVSSMFYGSRPINLTGMFIGNSLAQYEANRKALIQAVQIERDQYGMPLPTRVEFVTLSGERYFVNAYFYKPNIDWDGIKYGRFLLQATVPDPFIYDTVQMTSEQITQAAGGGFLSPFESPFLTEASTGGTANISNSGNVAVYPVIQMSGSLTNPVITNSTTGQSLRLTYTLAAGNTAIIDMRNKTITLNNSSSLLSTKSPDSSWWALNVGNNAITLTTGSTSDSGNLVISYFKGYAGV